MEKHEITAISTTLSYVAKLVTDLRSELQAIRTGQEQLSAAIKRFQHEVTRRVITPAKLRNEIAKLRTRCATQRCEIVKLNKVLNENFP